MSSFGDDDDLLVGADLETIDPRLLQEATPVKPTNRAPHNSLANQFGQDTTAAPYASGNQSFQTNQGTTVVQNPRSQEQQRNVHAPPGMGPMSNNINSRAGPNTVPHNTVPPNGIPNNPSSMQMHHQTNQGSLHQQSTSSERPKQAQMQPGPGQQQINQSTTVPPQPGPHPMQNQQERTHLPPQQNAQQTGEQNRNVQNGASNGHQGPGYQQKENQMQSALKPSPTRSLDASKRLVTQKSAPGGLGMGQGGGASFPQRSGPNATNNNPKNSGQGHPRQNGMQQNTGQHRTSQAGQQEGGQQHNGQNVNMQSANGQQQMKRGLDALDPRPNGSGFAQHSGSAPGSAVQNTMHPQHMQAENGSGQRFAPAMKRPRTEIPGFT
ncbi:uncharacterized protein EV422DRAFT_424729 [Fimicolochytrium jonesii]|uniref:uncharacterized protein n=1 Tax=Fimicolochytrium jonesii TaxID=1396493 RepID=UPI0022FE9203|nr:uncharacterized protein EV422DRAFT_424729 [Fimicolochytrium jonesii]KAI8821634.1 hypothetical protein EV422DRAFT_424729 [Fimicolochytrium jonesii]